MPWDPGQKWENKPSTATPLSADRLNSREKSITDYVDERIDDHTHIIDQVDGLSNALANKADVGHTHTTLPSEAEKAALAGTSGTPGLTNRYVTAQDPRRPPLAGGTIQTTHVLTPAEANATLIHREQDARTVIAPDHLSPAGTLPEGAVVRIARAKTAGPVVIDKALNATLIGPAGTTGPYIVAAGGVVRLHRVQGVSGESLYVVEGDLTVAPRLPDPTNADEGDVLTIGSGGPEWAEPQGGLDATSWTAFEESSDWVGGGNPSTPPAWRRVGDTVYLTGVVTMTIQNGKFGLDLCSAGANMPEEIRPQFAQWGLVPVVSSGGGLSIGDVLPIHFHPVIITIGNSLSGDEFIDEGATFSLGSCFYSLAPPPEE